jgi:phosphonate utilization transcriptional regulator
MKPTPGFQAIELLQSHSLTTLVQREVERMILSGELTSGAKLNEAEIATRLGVSRGPVREAFRALEEAGLVRTEKNRGVFVRVIAIDEADQIFELRATFDQMAGRKLAATLTDEQRKELRGLLERMEKATARGDLDAYHEVNLRFHDALVEFAGNQKLVQAYRRVVNELNLFRRHSLAQHDRLPNSTREHRKILEAISSGNAETAGNLLYEHVMASRERMHKVYAASDKELAGASKDRGAKSK